MRASSHGWSSAFSGRTTLTGVPLRSFLRFVGHSLIANSEGSVAALLGDASDATSRRGTVSTQGHIVAILFTAAPPRRTMWVENCQRPVCHESDGSDLCSSLGPIGCSGGSKSSQFMQLVGAHLMPSFSKRYCTTTSFREERHRKLTFLRHSSRVTGRPEVMPP